MTDAPPPTASSTSTDGVPVTVENVTKRYDGPDGAVTALDDVTVTFEPGAVTGLLGPNGAGKTTLMKIVLGLLAPTDGTVEIGGQSVHRDPQTAARRVSAVLEGSRNVYWRLTPLENMAFFAAIQGLNPLSRRSEHREILARFGLAEKADTPVNELSRGMKQKVSIACALARETEVLLLDEPTLGLDVQSTRELRSELASLAADENRTIVLSSHDMDTIRAICDRVAIIEDGKLIADRDLDTLVDLFARDWYTVEITGELPASYRRRLRRRFDVRGWDADGDTTRFRVSEDDQTAIADVVGAVVDAGAELERVERGQPPLEEIFLDLVADGPDEASRSAGVTA